MGPARFEQDTTQRGDERQVDDVEPGGTRVTVIGVAVPGPRGVEDHVEGFECEFVIADRGHDARAVEPDAQRCGRVAMRGRRLAGEEELDSGMQSVGRRRPLQARIREQRNSTLGGRPLE
jgi:hypothetical protein